MLQRTAGSCKGSTPPGELTRKQFAENLPPRKLLSRTGKRRYRLERAVSKSGCQLEWYHGSKPFRLLTGTRGFFYFHNPEEQSWPGS
jgi:hypothetical protein